MLGLYPIVPEPSPATLRNPDIDRYLRAEYGAGMTVAAFLAGAPVSRKSRTMGRNRFAAAARALVKALRHIATGHRSKATTSEA